ncbi:MAG: NRDE family protein [Bacteroidia bacterium]
MCTLLFNKFKNSIVFTSNRDDNILRNATEFEKINHQNYQIFYPKDKLKGGTWLAFDSRGNVAILLNGCDEKHIKMPYHTSSRGYIAIDFLKMNVSVSEFAHQYCFKSFEPFTLVVLKNGQLQELKWNDKENVITVFENIPENKIWSSVTLYDKENREKRAAIFADFIKNVEINTTALFELLSTKKDDLENGFYINRSCLQTLTTSQIELLQNEIRFKVFNHISKEYTHINISTNEVLVSQ